MAIFNCYVSSPEGTTFLLVSPTSPGRKGRHGSVEGHQVAVNVQQLRQLQEFQGQQPAAPAASLLRGADAAGDRDDLRKGKLRRFLLCWLPSGDD